MLQGIPALMVAQLPVGRGFYRSVTLDQPASDLTDFPVLFTGTYTYLKTIGNGGKVSNSNGYDITFYSDSALTTLLDFERVFWDAATGDVEFWIKIPTLASGSATVIYLAYGDTSISTDQQDAANTWNSGYVGVWHMGSPTSLSLNDSKGGVNGSNNGIQASTGKIGGAAFADGASNADFGNNVDFATGDMTISMWLKYTGTGGGYVSNKINPSGAGWVVYINNPGGAAWNPWLYLQTDGSNWKQIGHNQAAAFNDGVWRHYLFTRASGSVNMTGFVNNSATNVVTQSAGTIGTVTNSESLFLGSRSAGDIFFTGYVDDVKVENTIRSSSWRATMYSNENDPANFYTIGSETAA